ncbi:MBG domain-containing protein [Dokdonella sp.]|uniref:MBG domain-containing protein n=1 Tax=Dokdonella sp. TaxID=2291710 RepID=UPI003529582A
MERLNLSLRRTFSSCVLFLVAMLGANGMAHAGGTIRYVNAAGGVDTGNCTSAGSPCLTIAYAIGQAAINETISIAPGTYVSPLLVNKEGLRLEGSNPADKPVLTRISGPTNQALLVINGVRNVQVRNLNFAMDQTFVAEGILASGFVDGLLIADNSFMSSRSNFLVNSSYGFRNAISINDTQNSQGLPRVNGSFVTVNGNTFNGVVDIPTSLFMRIAIDMDGGTGAITNNQITAGVHDIRVRFPTSTVASSATTTLIDGNTLNGRGLELAVPNASSGALTISNNQINAAAGINDSTPYPADFSLMRLIGNSQAIPLTVSGNTFAGHQGSYRGVLVENFPGTLFSGNTFTPAPGASDFQSLVVSNKQLSTGTPAAPLPMAITATGNIFNGSGIAGAGRAVEFLDDNNDNGAATFGSLLFGGAAPGEANQFDVNLRWYFHLDNNNCNTVSAPTCTFLDYAGAIGSNPNTNTQVRPFSGNVIAVNNEFDGVVPSAMTASQKSSLLGHTFDQMADPQLGIVDYGIMATTPMVFVDDDYAGSSYGDPLVFNHGAVNPGTVYFGINAFATIPVGVMHVDVGGPVYVAKGNYSDSVTLAKAVQIIGDGNSAIDTLVSNAVTINTSGASMAAPLLLQNLRVSNPAGDGVLVSSASHIAFDQVSFSGNGGVGLNLVGVSDDIVIEDSLFDANASSGMRTATTTQASNVSISGTTFSNNSAGIILFGASASGNGQIIDWNISNSQFLSNDNANASGFGGGIWLKTGGAGSAINGFSVTGSTFADNGSTNSLNQVGITVRARPGTTVQNVSICNNSFVENAATLGTQLTGINVFDDTGNTGYQPITVCADNSFTGLGHSVSGLEQFTLRGTQPVVNITGGSIAETEYINGLVTRVRDGALFPSISAGMNDAGTIDGDELSAPAGLYLENVTFSHDNMTLSGAGAGTIIDGGNGNQPGITLPNGRMGSTITNLSVRNVHNSCIYGAAGNHGTSIVDTVLTNCRADLGGFNGGGVYMNGPVDSVTFDGNEVSASAARGLVIWNGYKSNITITDNYVHDMTGCCGIELQDGTASGVTVTGNVVENVGDSGMAFIGLQSGAGANLIDNNTISNTGRFGIEIKLPNGTGETTGDGSIVVSNNMVTRPAMPTSTDQRDVSGISVIRRGYCPTCGETDTVSGVVVTGNTVSGWVPVAGSPNDGFGIVMEGTGSSVYANTLSANDVALQLQAGNDGFPGDSNQAATNDFFSRGNAPATCVAVGSNDFAGNDVDSRSVSNPAGQHLERSVENNSRGTFFCSIQAAIDDPATQSGDLILVGPGVYAENVVLNKGVTLLGPFSGTTGFDPLRTGMGEATIHPPSGTALTLAASNSNVRGFTIRVDTGVAILPGGASRDNLQLANNRIVDIGNGVGIRFEPGTGNPASGFTITGNLFANIGGTGLNGTAIQLYKGTINAEVSNNHFDSVENIAIQMNGGNGSVLNSSILGNVISDPMSVGTSNAFVVTNAAGIQIRGNEVSGVATGLFLSDKEESIDFSCNSISGANRGISTFPFFGGVPNTGIRILHNAIVGSITADVNNGLAQDLVVGSNWYGGGNAVVTGSNAYVADGLPVNPIGNPACGSNSPTAVVAYAGSGQSTLVNTAFANPLQARMVDVLGGAVMGESMSFIPPMSGASAVLGTPSSVTNYNGVISSTATANNLAGSYEVVASSDSMNLTASLSLTNDPIIGTVTWDELSFVYDGNTHVATAFITEEPGTACVVTPVFGPNVGDYAVSATCNGTTYAASGTNTASITPADATLALSNLVQVFDGTPKSATVSSTPSGVAYSVTYNGSATAPSAVGVYAVVATITDGNYTGPQASGVLQIIEADAPDLAVTITDNRSFVQYGKLLTYTIVVNNPGNTDISGASVVSNLPITLLNASPSWECVQVSPGASCTPSGTGNLNDAALGIPAGGGVVYLFNAWVDDNASLPTDLIETEVTVTAASDSNPGNDSATDLTQIVIFRDGFDPGGDGAEDGDSLVNPDTASTLAGDTVKTLALAGAWTSEGRIVELARIGNGEARYEVQALRTSQQLLVRLLGPDRVSAWTAVAEGTAQLAIGLAEGQLLLVGGRDDLQLALASTSGLTIHLPRAD